MTKNIYKHQCLNYLKKGYSVIPDKYAKKRPAISKWTEFCNRLPSIDEVKGWGTSFNTSNIAVCLGPASGIVALDLDCVDPEILAIIEPLLPPSPCEKRGSKGYTRFFKYTNETTSVIKVNGQVVLELLASGKKTTIPPSVHPDGYKYEWLGGSLLDVDKDSLPVLPAALFSHLEMKLQNVELNVYEHKKIKTGRTLALGAKASEYIALQKDLSSSISDLIKYDAENHEKPLFTDPQENQGISNSYLNALKFYTDYLKSINMKRIKEGKDLELPLAALNEIKPFNSQSLKPDTRIHKLPKATGLLKDIQDYILKRSYVEQPVFALSAALSLLGTLVGQRMVFQGATPNTFILNVADSGSGKDSCQQAIKDILVAVGAEKLLGATTYPSEASIISNLAGNPVRLDIIDEASSFLKTASGQGASYAIGIGDTLCELFSCSNSRYLGKVLASNGGDRIGECFRPHLNLLCSTTYKGISESLSRSTLEKGLFARFLVFFGENNRRGKRVKGSQYLGSDVKEKLMYLKDFKNPLSTGNLDNKPFEISVSEEADALLSKYHEFFDIMRVSETSNGTARPIIARLFQQMMKIVLISAIGNTNVDALPKVTTKDVEFGFNLIQFYFQSIEGFVNDNLYDSNRGQKVNQILRLIKQSGDAGVSDNDLTKLTKFVTRNERQEILKDLLHSAQIQMNVEPNSKTAIFKEVV